MSARPVPLTHVRHDPELTQRRPSQSPLQLLRRVFSYTLPHRHLLIPLIAQVILRALLLPVGTWAIAAIINGPIEHRDPTGIGVGVLAFGLLAVFTNVMFHYRYKLALQLGEAVIHDLRAELMNHIYRLPMVFFDTTKTGRIIGRVTSDIDSIRTGVQDVVFISAVQMGQMFVAASLMIYYDWRLFCLVLLLAPVIWSLNTTFSRRMTAAQRSATESYSRIAATLAESVSGVRITQGFVRENLNAEYFRDLAADQAKYNMAMAKESALFLPLLECNTQIFTTLLLLIGGWRLLRTQSSAELAHIVQFLFLSGLLFEPIKNVGTQYTAALAAMVGAERVFHLLDTPPSWRDTGQTLLPDKPVPNSGMHVEFQNINFAYDENRQVLKQITFTAKPGQTIALVGHTGSGKTTITNLLSKLYLPQEGSIFLDGYEIRKINTRSLHSQMGVVHQQNFLFAGTIFENIRFGCPEATEADVCKTIEQLGLLGLLNAIPNGLHTNIGEGGTGLSSGQKQLVSFARALLVNPRLLILDEATSAIDIATETMIQTALDTLLKGRTSFVVAHRLSTIRKADLILVLNEGSIVERGTHLELMRSDGPYSRLYARFVEA